MFGGRDEWELLRVVDREQGRVCDRHHVRGRRRLVRLAPFVLRASVRGSAAAGR